MRIVINTPAGNIGRVVTEQLLQKGHELVIISRHPDKVHDFVRRGARLVVGSFDDAAVLDNAFSAADAVFWLTPLVFDQADFLGWARTMGQRAAEIAGRHHIQRAVLISSVGAQHEDGVGPIGCMPTIERAFAQHVPNVTVFRCGHFMENFLMSLDTIAQQGAIYSAYPANKKLPLVASRDIAQKAIEALLDSSWTGFKLQGVHGPEDITYTAATRLIGEAIGRPVNYVEVPVEAAKAAMVSAGMPPHIAALLGELYEGVHAGRVARAESRDASTTTQTTISQFAQHVLRPAIERMANANAERQVA